ncbi:hypothetical protein SAMN05421874_13813 [Nonomuraea maritima]|uniref:Uncharacterized protein n=1 Tax=Nonomuraea maritima TaxID=683260 RepID=A0A1G9QBJ2_9ACTN|nr:hypothetical protein SAMN05421874_13813 [Nonomuraea maritima]
MNRVMLWAGPGVVMGLVLIESGTYIQRGVPAWLLAVPLAIACAGVLVRQRAFRTAGAGRRTAGGRCRRLDASRAGGAGLHRSRVVQRGDRRRARHGRGDDEDARQPRDGQAGVEEPGTGRDPLLGGPVEPVAGRGCGPRSTTAGPVGRDVLLGGSEGEGALSSGGPSGLLASGGPSGFLASGDFHGASQLGSLRASRLGAYLRASRLGRLSRAPRFGRVSVSPRSAGPYADAAWSAGTYR